MKAIYAAITRLLKQVWLLPLTVAHALKQKRQHVVLSEHEIERLDRIRNPSKYLGK